MNKIVEENFTYFEDKSPPLVIVENFYDENELDLIWRELNFLTSQDKLLEPEETGSATENGKILKRNKGIFLDVAYGIRKVSDILTINRKLFNMDFCDKLVKINPLFRTLKTSNYDSTLISYYENEGMYNKHTDTSTLTAVTYFFKEPKKFFGGDIIFNDYNIQVRIKNNMLIIFPSCLFHEVTEIKMEKNNFDGFGRYCMTQFISTMTGN